MDLSVLYVIAFGVIIVVSPMIYRVLGVKLREWQEKRMRQSIFGDSDGRDSQKYRNIPKPNLLRGQNLRIENLWSPNEECPNCNTENHGNRKACSSCGVESAKKAASIKPHAISPPKPVETKNSIGSIVADKLIMIWMGVCAIGLIIAYLWIGLKFIAVYFPLILVAIALSNWAKNLDDTKRILLVIVLIFVGVVWLVNFGAIWRWADF